jgi:hypothetical protein
VAVEVHVGNVAETIPPRSVPRRRGGARRTICCRCAPQRPWA